MTDLIIKDIPNEIGPGDIVGAFTNEANIDGNKIGKIDFKEGNAIVEIEDNVAQKVSEVMNGNRISGVEVNVEIDDKLRKELKELKQYISKYKYLVQLEREEEMMQHETEIKNLSGYQREQKGRAILHLRARDEGQAFGGKFLIKFMRQYKGEKLPDTEISIGDLVMLSKNKPLDKDNPTGTVIKKTNYSITVVFDNKPPKFIYGKKLRMDLYVNDITFQRMLDALDILDSAEGRLKKLREKLLGITSPKFNEEPEVEFSNQNLNKAQQSAVRSALAAEDFFLIHGPPGTGKTMTSIEILEQATKTKQRILATADSNTAVDNMVERLVNRGLNVLRVGHPARVNPILREHTLDYLIENNPKYKQAAQLREKAYQLLEEQEDYTHPSGRWRRGMNNEQIRNLAQENRGNRGVPASKIREMSKWLELQEQVDQLFNQVDQLELEAVEELIANADVVCTTNSTSGSDILEEKSFDLLLIDEATQATEPSALIPLVKANKVILAGDHKQLPPTILNEKAAHKGLAKSLFERLLAVHGSSIKEMLTIQYRMNEDIMNFASQEFYKGQLVAAKQVKNWSLKDLDLDLPKGNAPAEQALNCEKKVIFFDTVGMNAPEHSKRDSKSIYNQIEAEMSSEVVNEAINTGIDLSQIAVISPYKDQVDLINRLVKSPKIEVNTVDGFQGREKEIIILSLVRSNINQNIGFLRDIRRLNVSLTRAKKKLIVIGDSSTVGAHPIYNDLIEYIKSVGYYYNL